MAREIKFRAWDEEEKKMHYSDSKWSYDISFSMDRGKVECIRNCAYTDTFGDEHDDWQPIDNIMECIGLHDRNDNEIYEDDIVEIVGKDGYFIIEWNTTEARWQMNSISEDYIVDFDNYWASDVTVVGNKYSNPELLVSVN